MELISNKKWGQPHPFTHKVTLLYFDLRLRSWSLLRKVSSAHFAEIQLLIFYAKFHFGLTILWCQMQILVCLCVLHICICQHSSSLACLALSTVSLDPNYAEKKLELKATAVTTLTHNVHCLEEQSHSLSETNKQPKVFTTYSMLYFSGTKVCSSTAGPLGWP